MKNIFLLAFIILITGSLSATANSEHSRPGNNNSAVSIGSTAAYYSDYLNHQSLSLFDHYRLEKTFIDDKFTFHEKRKPKIDLFNLLMTGLAVGGAVIMASGGGGGSSVSGAAPTAPPPGSMTQPPRILPPVDCVKEPTNPVCPSGEIRTTLVSSQNPTESQSLATVTLNNNGQASLAVVTLASPPLEYDVTGGKKVTIEQINRQEIVTMTNGQTRTITLISRETITLDSSNTTITATLTTQDSITVLNTANLSVTEENKTLSIEGNVTVIDCRISNGITLTVTTTVRSNPLGLSTAIYNVNGTLDARPYVFRDGHIQESAGSYGNVNINFKTNKFRTVYQRYRVPGCSQRDDDCYRRRRLLQRININLPNADLNRDDANFPKYLYFYYLGGTIRLSHVYSSDGDERTRVYRSYETGTGRVAGQQITPNNWDIERVSRELRGKPLMLSHTPIVDQNIRANHIGYHSEKQTWFGAGDFTILDKDNKPVYSTQFREAAAGGGSGPMVFYMTEAQDYRDILPGERDNRGSFSGFRFSFPVIENGKRRRSCILRPRRGSHDDNQGEYFVDVFGTRRYEISKFTGTELLVAYTDNVKLTTLQIKNLAFGYDPGFNNLQFSYRTTPITLQGLVLATERGFRKIRNSNSNMVFNKINMSYNWDNNPTKSLVAPEKMVSVRLAGEYMNGSIKSDIYAPGLLAGYRLGAEVEYPGFSPQDQFSLGVQRRFSAKESASREISWRYDLNYERKAIHFNWSHELDKKVSKVYLGYQQKF